MRRWHQETNLMFKRWKMEMALHRYDWRNPPQLSCDPNDQGVRGVCHCAAGIGSMRKRTPYDCGRALCFTCHSGKLLYGHRTDRYNKRREAIRYELEAEGDIL